MSNRKSTINNRKWIRQKCRIAVVLVCIVGVTYTKAGSPSQLASADAGTGQWQTIRMRVTAYCPCTKCCGQDAAGITANGHKIQRGDTFIAADRKFAFGTEMIIPGYNNGKPVKVLDRGGAIRGDKLDAFFHTHQAALEWGVQYLNVQVRVN